MNNEFDDSFYKDMISLQFILKEKRKEKKMSKKDLSFYARIPKRQISLLENDILKAKLISIYKILNFYQIPFKLEIIL